MIHRPTRRAFLLAAASVPLAAVGVRQAVDPFKLADFKWLNAVRHVSWSGPGTAEYWERQCAVKPYLHSTTHFPNGNVLYDVRCVDDPQPYRGDL